MRAMFAPLALVLAGLLFALLAVASVFSSLPNAHAADTRPVWERVKCSETRPNNCYIDATETKQSDYSLYRIRVKDRVAVVYWARFMQKHNHMEPLSTVKVVRP